MKETPQAAQAFEDYYNLGDDRDLVTLARNRRQVLERQYQDSTKTVPSEATLLSRFKGWSTEHGWQERVKARDRESAEVKRKKHDADIELMNERHAKIGTNLQLKGLNQLEELLKSGQVNASEAIRMVKQGMDAERVARGEPTERSEIDLNVSGARDELFNKLKVSAERDESSQSQ